MTNLDFALGETADMIREKLRRFAADRIAPIAAKVDREDWFPLDLWPAMGALGLHGITVAEEDGGLGLGYLEHVIACEEISRASGSVEPQLRRPFQSLHQPDRTLGHGRAEGQISARPDLRRACR